MPYIIEYILDDCKEFHSIVETEDEVKKIKEDLLLLFEDDGGFEEIIITKK